MAKKSAARQKMPTMYDVARLAGVSQPTVSRVLNDNNTSVQISDETRQRVMAAIEELGYRPNILARSLRTQRTQTIALMIADLSNAFYHPVARAVQDMAHQRKFEVLIFNSDHLHENEIHFCEVVSRRPVDGVLMSPYHLTPEDIDKYFSPSQTPVAVLGPHVNHPLVDVIYVDDERASYEAICWMIAERGYRDFGFLGVTDNLRPGARRFRGFLRALDESGITFDERFLVKGDFTLESGVDAARQYLALERLPRAIYAINDLMAIGLVLTLQESGVRIPDDVAVLGFDDIPEARIVRPMLTTIAQDPREMGRSLVTALFERMDSVEELPRRIIEAKSHLVVRDSA
ncbi:MAG: LacI family DNA-binding transcriptional regulator [Chloroflexi bacterium]|nr:LacI family DNA-binding transcriptional regulator [Chloroflexota bacterium]